VTKVDRVGPMFKGKTPPVGEDKHGFHKRGLKGRVVVLAILFSLEKSPEPLCCSNGNGYKFRRNSSYWEEVHLY
jgi:hypothetical protein